MATVKKNNISGDYFKPFPTRLRKLMESQNVGQSQLAKDLHITRQAVNSYVLGLTVPDIERLELMARKFNVPSDYLLGLTDNKDKNNIDIGAALGLSDKAIEALKECHTNGGENIIQAVCALLEEQDTLRAITEYLFFEPEAEGLEAVPPHLVFSAKYHDINAEIRYSQVDGVLTNENLPVYSNSRTVFIDYDMRKRAQLLTVQDALKRMQEAESKKGGSDNGQHHETDE
jgi:transcriptional regulator with XRE-family HTH domain